MNVVKLSNLTKSCFDSVNFVAEEQISVKIAEPIIW